MQFAKAQGVVMREEVKPLPPSPPPLLERSREALLRLKVLLRYVTPTLQMM